MLIASLALVGALSSPATTATAAELGLDRLGTQRSIVVASGEHRTSAFLSSAGRLVVGSAGRSGRTVAVPVGCTPVAAAARAIALTCTTSVNQQIVYDLDRGGHCPVDPAGGTVGSHQPPGGALGDGRRVVVARRPAQPGDAPGDRLAHAARSQPRTDRSIRGPALRRPRCSSRQPTALCAASTASRRRDRGHQVPVAGAHRPLDDQHHTNRRRIRPTLRHAEQATPATRLKSRPRHGLRRLPTRSSHRLPGPSHRQAPDACVALKPNPTARRGWSPPDHLCASTRRYLPGGTAAHLPHLPNALRPDAAPAGI